MLCGKFPFKGKENKELYKCISRGQFTFPEDLNISNEVKVVIQRMLVVNNLTRVTAT